MALLTKVLLVFQLIALRMQNLLIVPQREEISTVSGAIIPSTQVILEKDAAPKLHVLIVKGIVTANMKLLALNGSAKMETTGLNVNQKQQMAN